MFKKDTESIDIIKIRQSIKSLKVNDGITFEEFLHNAKQLSQKEFEFIKCEMPVGSLVLFRLEKKLIFFTMLMYHHFIKYKSNYMKLPT